MQLHIARLCLDCEEVHDLQSCPVCGSESFAYLSRWVPAPERRRRPRLNPASPAAATYHELLTEQPKSRWLRRGLLGVAAVSVAGLVWRRTAGPSQGDGGLEKVDSR